MLTYLNPLTNGFLPLEAYKNRMKEVLDNASLPMELQVSNVLPGVNAAIHQVKVSVDEGVSKVNNKVDGLRSLMEEWREEVRSCQQQNNSSMAQFFRKFANVIDSRAREDSNDDHDESICACSPSEEGFKSSSY